MTARRVHGSAVAVLAGAALALVACVGAPCTTCAQQATTATSAGAPEGVRPDPDAVPPAPAYRLARTPQAGLLSTTTGTGATAATTATVVPLRLTDAGTFETVRLPTPAVGGAAPVALRLQYPATRAGVQVLVHAPDGGSVNGQRGGKRLPIAADGTLLFSFQPDASPGRYTLVARLDDVETILAFTVPPIVP